MSEMSKAMHGGWGWSAFLVGALAFLGAVAIFWAGPFAPQQSTSVGLGELAADIARSAARSAAGLEQPAPEPVVRDIDDYLEIGVALTGALAVIMGVGAMTAGGGIRPSIGGVALGGLAIAFQFFTQYAIMLLGVLLVMAVIYALRDVFSGLFGG